MAAAGISGDIDAATDCGARRMGYHQVKEDQRKVIKAFMNGNDVFACLPTGFGKSLCYSCLPLVYDINLQYSSPWSIIVVVSPLQALMKDQVKKLELRGVTAVSVFGHEDDETRQNIVSDMYQIVFTSPELLLRDKNWVDVFQSKSFSERLVGVVVDEAHCVKKWGSDFRKEFSKLGDLRGYFPSHLTYMALTATASSSTRKSIIKLLGMNKPVCITRSPCKRNIYYDVREKGENIETDLHYLVDELCKHRSKTKKTIIFCRSYNDCGRMYHYFKSHLKNNWTQPVGYPDISQFRLVDMFTATNTTKVKDSILKSFSIQESRLRVLIATVAFGMGIDCPDIRRVIHWGPPCDSEEYIQETGRAGRDGLPCDAVLYYSRRDIGYQHVDKSIVNYCKNKSDCRRKCLFSDFSYNTLDKPKDCICCDLCACICECEECKFDDTV